MLPSETRASVAEHTHTHWHSGNHIVSIVTIHATHTKDSITSAKGMFLLTLLKKARKGRNECRENVNNKNISELFFLSYFSCCGKPVGMLLNGTCRKPDSLPPKKIPSPYVTKPRNLWKPVSDPPLNKKKRLLRLLFISQYNCEL